MNKDNVTRNEFNSQMAKTERVEVIYDMGSNDVNKNWKLTTGIGEDTGIVSKEFVENSWYKLTAFLNSNFWSEFYIKCGGFGGTVIKFDHTTAFLYMTVSLTKNAIEVKKGGYTNTNDLTENSGSSYRIAKIERVL